MLISSSIQIEDGISQKVRKNKDTNEIVKKYETFYINSNGYQGRCNSLEEAKQLKESFKKRPSKQKEYFEKVKEKSNQRLEKMKKEYVGKKYNHLLIQNIYYDPKNTRHMATCKCDCGNTKDIVLNLILYGHTKACGCQLAENGKKVLDKYVNDGTRVTNYKYKARNDTGVKGVEKTPANRYRARIWYKGKAISSGTYDTLEEAKNARLTAEEKYFKPEIEKFNKKMEDENTEQFKIKFD